MPVTLAGVIDEIMGKHKNDSARLGSLAQFAIDQLDAHGLPGAVGGANELTVEGFGRAKDWDVAYNYAGKHRLLISLKSLWANASGTVPNRIDDLMGEAANVQQMSPEIVTGYILLFDTQADGVRKEDGRLWSAFFQDRVKHLAVRKAPLWNQGLIEGCWFVLIDSSRLPGQRLVDPVKADTEGNAFFTAILKELKIREPAIPFSKPIP